MALGMVAALRNNRLDRITALIDAGAAGGKLKIYNGARPATGGTATTLLGTLTFSVTSAPAASGGVLTFNAVTADSSADATSTATWARITDSDDNFVMDLNVGATGSGADIELSTTSIVTGGVISVSSATITEGNA